MALTLGNSSSEGRSAHWPVKSVTGRDMIVRSGWCVEIGGTLSKEERENRPQRENVRHARRGTPAETVTIPIARPSLPPAQAVPAPFATQGLDRLRHRSRCLAVDRVDRNDPPGR